ELSTHPHRCEPTGTSEGDSSAGSRPGQLVLPRYVKGVKTRTGSSYGPAIKCGRDRQGLNTTDPQNQAPKSFELDTQGRKLDSWQTTQMANTLKQMQ
ncbi:hypothetical protein BGX21_007411, partial [Mortierella sp. AD011]